MKKTSLLLIVFLSQSCATYTTSIPSHAPTEARVALSGATLDCAARTQKTAFLWFLGSSISSGVASILAGVSTNSTELTYDGRATIGLLALGFTGASAVSSIVALTHLWTSTEYTQRAGDVAAGVALTGSCSDAPTVEWRETASWPRPRSEEKERGTRGARCYPNDTCNAALSCVKSRCVKPEIKEPAPAERDVLDPDEGETN